MRILVSGATRTLKRYAGKFSDWLGVLLTPNDWASVASVIATGLPWAIDNAAYSGFNAVAFRGLLRRAATTDTSKLLFVSVPDIVGDCWATRAAFDRWQGEIRGLGLPLEQMEVAVLDSAISSVFRRNRALDRFDSAKLEEIVAELKKLHSELQRLNNQFAVNASHQALQLQF